MADNRSGGGPSGTPSQKSVKLPPEKHTIPRNDPYDCYKPNSDDAVAILATTPITEKLLADDASMLRSVAADMDRCSAFDEIEGFPTLQGVSEESREQLDRLPTWLRPMIEHRWPIIHGHFGHSTHTFLRTLANRIDTQYRSQFLRVIGTLAEDDEEQLIQDESNAGFQLIQDDLEEEKPVEMGVKIRAMFLVSQAVGKFKNLKNKAKFWEPHMIKRAESCLRTAMITKAAAADVAIVAEDDDAEKLADENRADSDAEEDTQGGGGGNAPPANTKGHWDSTIVVDRESMKQKAHEAINTMYQLTSEDHLTREEKRQMKLKKKMMQLEKKRKRITCWSYLKKNPLFVSINERRQRKKQLLERGLFRRYSRIWYKDCGEPIHHTKKLGHQFRMDEKFHTYVVSLVTWNAFKFLTMFIILANAFLLAVETGEHNELYQLIFDILDNFFLSVYTVEFLLKIYAHPYMYWKSGYNVFDFVILVISLSKSIMEWLNVAEVGFLRVLLIVRALRILRGVSLSVQLQVLVTALAETIKTHVLSVVILLILLMYIAAIVAFYLFGDKPGLKASWGNVAFGMLKMFTFVTMDGWTDITEEFQDNDQFYSGRIFGLVGIVLGNFLFSNIFIAIIIMNISEATESYRERQRAERDVIVTRKKNIVFRRQKLDMRQLLARQKMSISADFFHMGCQFQRLLRHDDLVAMQEVCTSPLWMDCLYKTFKRCHHTSNILMNLHREMADTLLDCHQFYGEGRYQVEPIRRARYNRYMKLKAKLALIKRELYSNRNPVQKSKLQVRLPANNSDIAVNSVDEI